MDATVTPDIIYTKVDEAPELASASLLPIIQYFASAAGVSVGTKDISLAGRILATFSDHLGENQRQPDDLAELGKLVKTPQANVIKLPNISASVPQLQAAIRELQAQGYPVPNYPETPANDAERDVRARYDAIKGSAVNPVLREAIPTVALPPPSRNSHRPTRTAWARGRRTARRAWPPCRAAISFPTRHPSRSTVT